MSDLKIIDSAIDQKIAYELETFFLDNLLFPWFYDQSLAAFSSERIGENFTLNSYKFFHMIYKNHAPNSDSISKIQPIIDVLKANAIVNIRAYMSTYTASPYVGSFHIDDTDEVDHVTGRYTAIYYVNTNNGKTIFEDGQEVNSIKNRLVIFPFNKKHAIVTATDVKARVVINFNYFSLTNPFKS